MMLKIFVVLAGGALGALCRYQVGTVVTSSWSFPFPLHTFAVNVLGAFLLGFVNVLLVQKLDISPLWWLGIGVGFLGAFTTFSTFSLETITLLAEGKVGIAAYYTVLSLIAGFGGAFVGIMLGRLALSAIPG